MIFFESIASLDKDKSPGSDRLTKFFYQIFLQDVKYIFLQESKRLKYLCQAIVKQLLNYWNNQTKVNYISTWRPISLLI